MDEFNETKMIDSMEEPKIKIEYYESFETDPLEDVPMKTEVIPIHHNVDNGINYDVGKLEEFSKKSAEIQTTEPIVIPESEQHNIEFNASPETKISVIQSSNDHGQFVCKLCNISYKHVRFLRQHLKTKHVNGVELVKTAFMKSGRKTGATCHICQTKFDAVKLLKEHLKCSHYIDLIKLNYKTEINDCQEVKTTKNLKTPSDGIDKYKCPYCEHTSKRQFCINRHITIIHKIDKKDYSCQLCTYTAPVKYYLDIHITSKHPDTYLANTKKIYLCETCGYRTPKRSHHLKHIKIHTYTKNHKCNYCNYATHCKNTLKIHIRTHTKEKPYKCEINDCEYRCVSKTALNMHSVKHYPEKFMLFCDKCLYKTAYKQSLRRHLETHIKCIR